MYKVSVIVPVYNVERYLRGCMDSLMAQTLRDIEIVAVNDGSPDGSLAILEEYEARYAPKVKVFTIENHGVSYARNYGAEHASGEFLMFVDSDDYVEPELCEALYEKAVRDGNDLVLCYRNNVYERHTQEDVVIQPSSLMTAGQNFALKDVPYEMLWLSPFPWDKLVKRELFLQVRFPVGIRFEDLAYVLKISCIAESIGVVREPLYNYRRITGGFLNSFSEATLDILKAFENVLAYMKEHGFYETYREELAYICARHFFFRYPALLEKKTKQWKLKKQLVRETQNFLNENFPGWEDNRYLKYSSADSIKKNLAAYRSRRRMLLTIDLESITPDPVWNWCMTKGKKLKDFWREFRTSHSKSKVLMKHFRIFRLMKMPATYGYTKAFLRYPVKKELVLFESSHGESLGGNIFHMLSVFQRPEYEGYRPLLVLTEKMKERWEQLSREYDLNRVTVVEAGSRNYFRALASAGYLVTDTSFPTWFVKKEEQVYLNTWHGTPLKGMGRQVPGREFGLGNVQRNFLIADYLLYQNEFSRDVFIDDYMLRSIYPGKVLLSGYPRNSALLNPALGEKIRREHQLTGKRLIAYMPTWRGVLHKKNFSAQIRIIYQYLSQIDEALDDDTVFFVRLHPYVNDTIRYEGFRHIRPFLSQYDPYDFLNATDMLVTDYSSIMFDYAVSGKKIVLFAYDREEYLRERGMYIDLDTIEFPVVETVEELVAELGRPNRGYPEFQRRFCGYDSADTLEKVCRMLVTGEETVKCGPVQKTAERPVVLIYAEGVENRNVLSRLIQEVNLLDHDRYQFCLAFMASAVQKNTELLSGLDQRAGYLALQRGINALLRDYLAKWFYLKRGWTNPWVEHRLKGFCLRETRKFYGCAKFDHIIYYSGRNALNVRELSLMSGRKICNLTAYTQRMYDSSPEYRKYVKRVTSGSVGFDEFCVNKEFEASPLYGKTCARVNYRVLGEGRFGIRELLEGKE